MRLVFSVVLGLGIALLATGCSDDDTSSGTNCSTSIDPATVQAAFRAEATASLRRAAGALIVARDLHTRYFNTPNQINLDLFRDSLSAAREAWVAAEPYQYGPDGSRTEGSSINPFPVNEALVDEYLDGTRAFDRNSEPDFDRGFPALAYYAFGSGRPTSQAGSVTTTDLRFVNDVFSDLLTGINQVQIVWEEAISFDTEVGTAAGTPFSVIINAVSKHFEDARRDRLGTPFGIDALGVPFPQTVEALHEGSSFNLLRTSIEASQQAFNLGIRPYLQGMNGDGASSLLTDVNTQYVRSLSAFAAVDQPLSEAVVSDIDDVQLLYNELSRQVVNLKTDVSAVTCVAITYVDNPSDSD